MSFMTTLRGSLGAIAASAMLIASAPDAQAEAITLTDIAGREVTLPKAPTRIILGEGRMMYAVGALEDGNPFERLIGWKSDLVQFDPDAYRQFAAVFPEEAARMIDFGNPYSGDFSIETVLQNEADLLLLEIGGLFNAEETGLLEKLDEAGVPVVFVDFRRNATENTVPSMLILGRIFEEEANAARFIDFYNSELRRVTNIVDLIPAEDRPLVVMDNAAGWQADFCCWSFGPYNYGRFIELAGGVNMGSTLGNHYSIDLTLEGIIAADPDVIVGTGANWAEARPEVTATLLGYEGDPAENEPRIAALAARPGFDTLRATQEGRFHSIYHQFYNSPYHFVAIQQLAKWIHPADFEDLDVEATMTRLHDEFLPFDYTGQFWVSVPSN